MSRAQPNLARSDLARGAPTRGDLRIALIVLVTTFTAQLPFYDRWLSGMDEGHMALYAQIAAEGGAFYRDATFYPLPGAFLFLSWLFELFGPSLWMSRITVTIQFSLFVTLLFLVLRRMAPLRTALLAVFALWLYRVWTFPHWHIFSYSTTALFVFLVCTALLLRFFDTRQLPWLAAAGATYGLGVFCKQDYGAAMGVASAVALGVFARTTTAPERPSAARLALGFVGPAAAVGAASGLWFLFQGTLGDVLQLTVFNHFVGMSTYEYTAMPALWPVFSQDPVLRVPPGLGLYVPGILYTADAKTFFQSRLFQQTAVVDSLIKIFFYGPYLFYGFGVLRLWRGRGRLRDPENRGAAFTELLLVSFGAGLLAIFSLNRPQDYLHLAVLYWPIFGLLAVYGQGWRTALPRAGRAVLALGLVATLLPVTLYSGRLFWRLREIHTEPLDLPRAGIDVAPAEARVVRGAVEFVQTHSKPDETVAVMPYFPAIQFLAERRGPHRSSYIIWPFPEFPDRDEQIIASMEAQGTDVLVYHFNYFLDFPPVSEYAPELFAYLVDHFRIERIFSEERFGIRMSGALRNTEALEGRSLVPDDASQVELAVVAEGGRRAVEPAQRDAYLRRDLWPLRRVLALRPTVGGHTVIDLPARPRAGEHLRSAIGMRPDVWSSFHPAWVEFRVTVAHEGGREVIFERRLDSQRQLAERGWHEIDVDLSRFAETPIHLEFATRAEKPDGERLDMGGFEEPRLVDPRAPRSAGDRS